MKINTIGFCVISLYLSSCDPEMNAPKKLKSQGADSSAGLYLLGNEVDSVFLYIPYSDPGVTLFNNEYREYERKKNEAVEVKGQVDSRLPGTYTLSYSNRDHMGKPGIVLTRTVHVIQNSSTFLNGIYKASCTCTAVAQGAASPTLTSGHYTAMITSSNHRDEFSLSNLKIGPLEVTTQPTLIGDSLELGYFSPYYHQMAQYSASGTLNRSANSFSIHTRVMPYDPKITYTCINIYNKQLHIAAQEKR